MVRAIEEGRMTVEKAKIAYNIRMISTIKKWLRDSKRENEELVASSKSYMDKKEDNRQADLDSCKMARHVQKLFQDSCAQFFTQ